MCQDSPQYDPPGKFDGWARDRFKRSRSWAYQRMSEHVDSTLQTDEEIAAAHYRADLSPKQGKAQMDRYNAGTKALRSPNRPAKLDG